MALRLKKISIKGYKSIAEAELALRNLNVLIGANGAGKSNFIAMFGFLRRVAERRLQVSVREAGGGRKIAALWEQSLLISGNTTRFAALSLSPAPEAYRR
jgi:predicted ATPase